MMKRKVSKFLRRKPVIGVFLLLFVVFGVYSIKLMSARPYVVSTRSLGTFTAEGKLSHVGVLGNNTLYGRSVSLEDYPLPLVEEFRMTYNYRSNPGLSEGNYTFLVKATYYVSKGTEEVVLWEETLFEEKGPLADGSFSSGYALNVTELDNRSAEIAEELGMKRLRRRITVMAAVDGTGSVGGRKVTESFTHTSELVRDSSAELYYFVDTAKGESKPFTETSTSRANTTLFGISSDVETAQNAAVALAFVALLPLIGSVYLGRGPKDDMKKLRPYMVKGAPRNVDKKVYLRTEEDLEKAFNLLDRPIMTYIDGDEEVYVIINDGVAYEYRKPLPGAKKTAN
ncbi:MAG: hypothetical protein J7L37_00315 [Thermococcus sp.]|nr:hypothetical protein [Thermococcus sp.]